MKDINQGHGSSEINKFDGNFAEYNGKVYFTANNGIHGQEPWVTDGTASGTNMLANIDGGSTHYPRNLTVMNDKLYFIANDANGYEIFRYTDPALSIDEFKTNSLVKLFPNTTTYSFFFTEDLDASNVSIYDIHGKLTKQFNSLRNEYNIDDLSSGLYFVRIKANNREVTLKLLKQ